MGGEDGTCIGFGPEEESFRQFIKERIRAAADAKENNLVPAAGSFT